MDLNRVMKHMKKIVYKTGEYQIKQLKEKDFSIESKSTSVDLVTTVDKKSEEKILTYLKQHYDNITYLAEETGESDEESEYRWVLDPIDGTTNFVQGLPIFCISLALQKKKETIAGVVYNPCTNEMFSAIKGDGAYLNDERIYIANKEKLEDCVLATGFSYNRKTSLLGNLEVFNHFVSKVRGVRRMGSAAYDMCSVAKGSLDGYWEMGLNVWDVAAGELIVKEAGGVVLYFDKSDMLSIICGNEYITGQIFKVVTS